MTKIKICGLRNIIDARYAHKCGADALGFVVETPTNSPRNITREEAKTILQQLPPFAMSIGVIIPLNLPKTRTLIEATGLHTVQIHGDFNPQELQELKKLCNVQIIRSFGIDQHTKREQAISVIEENLQCGIDAILLDTKGTDGAGGTGKTHNWELSTDLCHSFSIPFILAGGLTIENVEQAISIVDPYAVDVSSGVEKSPGIKDHQKIQEFIQKVEALG